MAAKHRSTPYPVLLGTLLIALGYFCPEVRAGDLQTQTSSVNSGTHAALLSAGDCTAGDAVLPNGTLSGDPGVAPCGKLTANDVDIIASSTVHFRAGTSIAFGESFSVGAGAVFAAELILTTAGPAFVRDESPTAITDYYARFFINPNNLALDVDSDQFEHLVAYDAAGNREFMIGVTYESGVGQRRFFATAFDDSAVAHTTKDLCEPVLGNGWQFVEVHYTASTGTDGDLELSVNGGAPVSLSQCLGLAGGLDNDSGEISAVEWGAQNASAGYLGSMGLDDFDARAGAVLTSTPDRLQPASSVHNNQFIGFGSAVALDGNVLVVGSPGEDSAGASPIFDTGAVRVFERRGSTWIETDKLRAPVELSQERFGHSVDVALGDNGTDFLIVGARGFSGASGRAYIFKRENGGPWLQDGLPVAQEEPDGGDAFGEDVAIDFFQPPNDPNTTGPVFVAAVGSPFNRKDNANSQHGSVSIFQRSGGASTWGRTHEFFGAPNNRLGGSVAMGGPLIVVGAEALDNAGTNPGGALWYAQANLVVTAYHYAEGGKLLASDPQLGTSGLGLAAAMDNDPAGSGIAVLGAPGHDSGAFNTGKVYIFELSSAGLTRTEIASLQAPGTPTGAGFGTSVALSGPILAVGAPGVGSDGTVFLYEKGATAATWNFAGQLTVPDLPPVGACRGGESVALQGALAAAGCSTNSGGTDNEGVFLFFGDAIFSDGFESGDTSAWTSSTP